MFDLQQNISITLFVKRRCITLASADSTKLRLSKPYSHLINPPRHPFRRLVKIYCKAQAKLGPTLIWVSLGLIQLIQPNLTSTRVSEVVFCFPSEMKITLKNYRDSHITTDVNPEIIPGLQTGNIISHENIIYAALPMRAQTENTKFSCKDD